MRYLLALAGLLFAGSLAAQDCTFTLSAKKAGWTPDTAATVDSATGDTAAVTGIGVPKEGAVAIAVTQADSTCKATDANGTDGSAAVTIPEGEYTVIARAVGKKGGSFAVGDVKISRGKGKSLWQEVALGGDSWQVSNAQGATLQLRVIAAVSEPSE